MYELVGLCFPESMKSCLERVTSEGLSTESLMGPERLVLCCDATGNMFGEENSNVVMLYTTLEVDPPRVAYRQ